MGNGDRNELSFTMARATPCQVRFGLFPAQIAPYSPYRTKNARCYTSQLKYVFRLEENVSHAMGQNSLTPLGEQQLELSTRVYPNPNANLHVTRVFIL